MLQTFDERNRDLIVNINGRLVHRDEAGISPFDSRRAGRRRRVGRAAALRRPHLPARRAPRPPAALGAWPWPSETIPTARGDHRRDPPHARRQRHADGVHIRLTLTRGVKITRGMDPRLNQAGPTLIVLAEHKPPVYGDRRADA